MDRLFRDGGPGSEGIEKKRPGGPVERFGYRRSAGKVGPELKTVCRECNNGWMRLMDEDIEHLVTPLAYGASFELAYPEGNQALARWATKIALALSSEWNWPSLQARRTQFFTERETPDRARVWLGCMQWTPIGFAYLSGALGDPTDPDGYSITFRVLHMVLQVFIPAAPKSVASREGDSGSWYLQQVWPLLDIPLAFPPPEWIWIPDDDMFSFVANRLRDPERRPR